MTTTCSYLADCDVDGSGEGEALDEGLGHEVGEEAHAHQAHGDEDQTPSKAGGRCYPHLTNKPKRKEEKEKKKGKKKRLGVGGGVGWGWGGRREHHEQKLLGSSEIDEQLA